MKQVKLIIVFVIVSISLCGQVLKVPTDLTQRKDSSYWGGNIPFLITQWRLASWIDNSGTLNGTSIFSIENSFAPSNTELNEIESNGGDIENWGMYLRTADSTFFSDTVPTWVGGNTKEVKGRKTIDQKTWGEYFDENHEMYYNTFNGQYIILAADDQGNFLKLSTIIDIRNSYASVNGYLTIVGLADINPSNLIKREDW